MNTEKIVKVAGVLDTIAKIAGGILKAFGIVCIIFAVLVLIFGEKMFVEGGCDAGPGFREAVSG